MPNASFAPSALQASAETAALPGFFARISAPSSMRASMDHAVLEAGRGDLLFRMARDRDDALLVRQHHARLLAHRAVLAANGHRMSCSEPDVASHLPPAVQAIERTLAE